MECVTPGQVVLGHVGKQSEQAVESKLVSNVPLWSPLQFLSPGSCLEFCPMFPQ